MIARLGGTLLGIEGQTLLLGPLAPSAQGFDITIEVLVPAYLARRLMTQVGSVVALHTMTYLEGQGQGTSFIPRVIGFASPSDRAFFDLFTTVKGIGNRKALRALAQEPAEIAGAIVRSDARALSQLPEIGKRLAETVIAELKGKVDAYASTASIAGPGASVRRESLIETRFTPAQSDAVEALVNLGEQRVDAEKKILRAIDKKTPDDTPSLIAAVFAMGR